MNDHGYICKRCHGPAPVGVGYVANGADAAKASAGLTRCACGYSVDPSTTTNGDGTREQLQAAGEHTLELIESLRRHIDGNDCYVGQGCEVCTEYPERTPADSAHAFMGEWPLEVVQEVGTPWAVVLTVGGPHCEIVRDARGGPARWIGSWGTETVTMHDPAGEPFGWALGYFIEGGDR